MHTDVAEGYAAQCNGTKGADAEQEHLLPLVLLLFEWHPEERPTLRRLGRAQPRYLLAPARAESRDV